MHLKLIELVEVDACGDYVNRKGVIKNGALRKEVVIAENEDVSIG